MVTVVVATSIASTNRFGEGEVVVEEEGTAELSHSNDMKLVTRKPAHNKARAQLPKAADIYAFTAAASTRLRRHKLPED